MFKITGGKGFHITFDNGWTASVQFGVANYCSHHRDDLDMIGKEKEHSKWESSTAEVAAWPQSREMMRFGNGDTVKGWLTSQQVLAFLVEIAGRAEGNNEHPISP